MIKPSIPLNDIKRLQALYNYEILDTVNENEYDAITRLASSISGCKTSLISLVDENRQWFKSACNFAGKETSRDVSFCAHAINYNEPLIIPDAREDPRFIENPLVTDDPNIVFYAGFQLKDRDNYSLGTLCCIDYEPNYLNKNQINDLKDLATQTMSIFHTRKDSVRLNKQLYISKQKNEALKSFSRVIAHDLKSPLTSIIPMLDLLKAKYSNELGEKGLKIADMISKSTTVMDDLITGVLKYSQDTSLIQKDKVVLNLKDSLLKIASTVGLLDIIINFKFDDSSTIMVNKVALEQIFLNIMSNAKRYCNESKLILEIDFKEINDNYHFSISDNGPGIPKENLESIFELFKSYKNNESSESGTGIGLSTVKTLIEGLGGEINVESELGKGTKFSFTIPNKYIIN